MFTRRLLKKMGYGKGELKNMEIKDIIELGKLGYTKDEINQLKAEEKPEIPDDIKTQIDALTEKIDKLAADTQSAAAHQTVTTTDQAARTSDNIDSILSKLAGDVSQE